MAILENDSVNVSSPGDLIKPKREFRATGKGLMVDKPDFKADPFNANASLSLIKNRDEIFYLFVDRISTSWAISGSYAQAVASRSWMPRNLVMSDLIIEGTCANQHEYDKLVVFIRDNMYKAIGAVDEIYEKDSWVHLPALDFRLFPPGLGMRPDEQQIAWFDGKLEWPNSKNTYSHIPGRNAKRRVRMFIVVTNITAGHERFVFSPAFTLTCKVLWDVGDPDQDTDIKTSIEREIGYTQVFGELISPDPIGPEIDSKLPPSTYTGTNHSGTGGTGGTGITGGGRQGNFQQWAPDEHIDDLEKKYPGIKAWVDANAPGFSPDTPENIKRAREIKAMFPNAYPPGDRQYVGKMAQEGNAIKFRNPPNGTNTLRWR